MSKTISFSNESSFTIEDDVTYTVTGIVTYNTGTFLVSMKDCTIIKKLRILNKII